MSTSSIDILDLPIIAVRDLLGCFFTVDEPYGKSSLVYRFVKFARYTADLDVAKSYNELNAQEKRKIPNMIMRASGYSDAIQVNIENVHFYCGQTKEDLLKYVKYCQVTSFEWDAGAIYRVTGVEDISSDWDDMKSFYFLVDSPDLFVTNKVPMDALNLLNIQDDIDDDIHQHPIWRPASEHIHRGDIVWCYDNYAHCYADGDIRTRPIPLPGEPKSKRDIYIVLWTSDTCSKIYLYNLYRGSYLQVSAHDVVKLGSVCDATMDGPLAVQIDPYSGEAYRDVDTEPLYYISHDDAGNLVLRQFGIIPVLSVTHAFIRSCSIIRCSDCGRAILNISFDLDWGFPDRAINNIETFRSIEGGGYDVCAVCAQNPDWHECNICGNLFRLYDDETLDSMCVNGDLYCHTCLENRFARVNNYSYKPRPIFRSIPDDAKDRYDNKMYMGVELEIDNGRDGEYNACAKDLNACGNMGSDNELYYLKHDGSLNEGIEIVTHPCTLKYHLQRFPWEEVCEIAKNHGFRSHDAGTCGLHVHVSNEGFGEDRNEQDLNIAKVLLLFDKLWDDLVRFSRRNYDQLDSWAKKPNTNIDYTDDQTTANDKVGFYADDSDRYMAVNLKNLNTVEFRLFRGTLNVETLKATLEFLSNLILYVNSNSLLDIQHTTFEDIVNYHHYDELANYLERRNLITIDDDDDESEEDE